MKTNKINLVTVFTFSGINLLIVSLTVLMFLNTEKFFTEKFILSVILFFPLFLFFEEIISYLKKRKMIHLQKIGLIAFLCTSLFFMREIPLVSFVICFSSILLVILFKGKTIEKEKLLDVNTCIIKERGDLKDIQKQLNKYLKGTNQSFTNLVNLNRIETYERLEWIGDAIAFYRFIVVLFDIKYSPAKNDSHIITKEIIFHFFVPKEEIIDNMDKYLSQVKRESLLEKNKFIEFQKILRK